MIIETLCRLYFREADWDGSWWTTRPDTSGPYYKPVKWERTERIHARLQELIVGHDRELTRLLVLMAQKYKMDFAFSPAALTSVISDGKVAPSIRKKAFQTVTQISDEAALHALAACAPDDTFMVATRDEFVRDAQRAKAVDTFVSLATTGTPREAELAFTVLLFIAEQTNAPARVIELVQKTIARENGAAALQQAKKRGPAPLNPAIPSTTNSANVIAKLPYDEVVKRAAAASSGDARVGEKLFETVGCIKCHTVNKSDSPKGPFLGDITARYSTAEILESILRPSAKVAQGFETTSLETKAGDSIDGFIVRESGDEIELRNINGPIVVQKKNIAIRGTRKSSIMPDGLVDNISTEDLASLLRYLESMRSKSQTQ
jgi:putative heme-binding domain-containing protein